MKHIDKLFKEKIYNHEANVPDGMWDKIAPALEDKKGRAFFWFWLTGGLIAILLAGLSYYLLTNKDANGSIIPLVENNVVSNQETKQLQQSTPIALSTDTKPLKEKVVAQITPSSVSEQPKTESKINATPIATKTQSSKNRTQQENNALIIPNKQIANSTISTPSQKAYSSVNNDLKYGKPANLVITKSYISDEGSIIEQSNLTKDENIKKPSYNVFINSEGLNAGALLRIVEPLDILPLPLVKMEEKKKVLALSNI